jgi:hypothetical protein
MFDAKELKHVYDEGYLGCLKCGEESLHELKSAALLAVAAHVRAQTLREAAGVCERLRASWRHSIKMDNSHYHYEKAYETARDAINALAASARETGGAVTLAQSAARLHEKYGDALAKMDDAAPGERDGGKC